MILEIGFHPWLRDAYPDDVTWIDTSLRWDDVRSYQKKNGSPIDRLIHLVKQAIRALHLAATQPYDVVVARCLSTTNTLGCGPHIKCARMVLGCFFEWLILFAARGSRVKLVIVDATDRMTIHPRDRRLFPAASAGRRNRTTMSSPKRKACSANPRSSSSMLLSVSMIKASERMLSLARLVSWG